MYYDERQDETVSVGDWIGTVILLAIPLLNLILALVWAFGGMAKPSKRNFARAWLLIALVTTGLAVAAYFYGWTAFLAWVQSMMAGFYG